MITTSDISKLKAVFATKEDLKDFATKNDLVTFKDEILAEIQNLRADVAIVIGYRDMIEQHETDIEVIKKCLKLPPS